MNNRIIPNTIAWLNAHKCLISILPEMEEHITSPFYITPDEISKTAEQKGLELNWKKFKDWELHESSSDFFYEDDEVFDVMFQSLALKEGEVTLIPQYCFRHQKDPITVGCIELRPLIVNFPVTFFDGDAIFLFKSQSLVSLFHHEGAYAHLYGKNKRGST